MRPAFATVGLILCLAAPMQAQAKWHIGWHGPYRTTWSDRYKPNKHRSWSIRVRVRADKGTPHSEHKRKNENRACKRAHRKYVQRHGTNVPPSLALRTGCSRWSADERYHKREAKRLTGALLNLKQNLKGIV